MPDLDVEIEEVKKKLQAERVAADSAKTPKEKVAHLQAVKKLYIKLARLEISRVARVTRAAKVENRKLESAKAHFKFVLAGEILKRARADEGFRNIVTRAVGGIANPKEKEKATKILAIYQEEWAKPAPPPPKPKAATAKPASVSGR